MENNRTLAAEMVRRDVGREQIRRTIGCSEKSVYNKVSGKTPFTVDEAIKIQQTFFPDMGLKDLFFNLYKAGTVSGDVAAGAGAADNAAQGQAVRPGA